MPIPKTRRELVERVEGAFGKLTATLDAGGLRLGTRMCNDDWRVKDVLAVRSWWTSSVCDWIEAGRRGETFALPAEGFRWNQTPSLNQNIVQANRGHSYRSVRERLDKGCARALRVVAALSDCELLGVGAFSWAGKHPVARWVSVNTATQYISAGALVRAALREVR